MTETADEAVGFDIDAEYAAKAQEREATGGRIPIKLEGKWFHFKPMGEWSFNATRKINDDNDLDTFADEALDEDEADAFLELDFKLGKFELLMQRLQDGSGLGSGKARGSTRSSKKRRKR
jgi:hypothetical protein